MTPEIVGRFVDLLAGKVRSPAAVTGRLLEVVLELALNAGLSAGDIVDALHNQSLKSAARAGRTAFPSQLVGETDELAEECADVSIVLPAAEARAKVAALHREVEAVLSGSAAN